MTPLDYVIWSLFSLAVAVRILAGSRAINLYGTKYKRRMPSNWLWTPVDDPEVERWRRRAAVAPLLAILGLSLLFVKLVVVQPSRSLGRSVPREHPQRRLDPLLQGGTDPHLQAVRGPPPAPPAASSRAPAARATTSPSAAGRPADGAADAATPPPRPSP